MVIKNLAIVLLLLFLNYPPVREVCPNHEVFMLQPRTGTYADLGSVAIVNLITSLPRPTCFNRVLYICLPPPDLTTTVPPSVTF